MRQLRTSSTPSRATSTFAFAPVVFVLLVMFAPPVRAGAACIGGEFCEEPCPYTPCESDADCEADETCMELGPPACCVSANCQCLPETGEWSCTADCGTGKICVSPDPRDPDHAECVPAVSEAGAVLLAALLATVMARSLLRARTRAIEQH